MTPKFNFADLQHLVEDTNRSKAGGGKVSKFSRHTDILRPGAEIKLMDSGFVYNKKTKTGKIVPQSVQSFKGIIVDSVFRFELWGKNVSTGKPEFKDSTISHTSGEETGNGTWPFPLSTNKILEAYAPVCKTGLTLQEALETYKNAEGRPEITQKGHITFLVTAMDLGELDENDEPVGLKAVDPFIARLPLSGVFSQGSFTRFVSEVAKNPEPFNDYKSVVTLVTSDVHPKMPSKKMAKLEAVGQANDADLKKAGVMFDGAMAAAQAEQDQRLAEWKAKKEAEKDSSF